MNADKLSFEKGRFISALPKGPLLKENMKGAFRKTVLGVLLASGGFYANAQCDPAGTASGSFSSLGIFLGSNVTNPSDARDGNLSTYSLFWQGIGGGFISTHTLTVNMVGNGNQTDQLYIKAELNGSIISANIFSNLTVKYYFTDGSTATTNIGSSLASWGFIIGGTTTNNGLYLDAPGKQFNKIDIAFVSPAAVSIAGELARIYEVKRVPAQPSAPSVTGSGTTISNCFSTATTYTITNPSSGLVYRWYNAGTGGTLLDTGTSYTTPAALANGTNTVYVEAVAANTCPFPTQRISASRTAASVTVTICDSDGDGVANSTDLDDDNDGIADLLEGYNASNPSASRDTDGDGIPDYMDLDSDNDGINDVRENNGTDANGDGKADGAVAANGIPASAGANGMALLDTDGDGIPNTRDLDSDNDGITDLKESGNTAIVDANNDGRVDGAVDTDKDGIIGSADGAPSTWGDASDPVLVDTDGDGVPNMRDLDSDNDSINDLKEAGASSSNATFTGVDPNTGIPTAAGNGLLVADTDGDGITNEKDLDSDNDGISDIQEHQFSLGDTNQDGKADGADPDGDGILGLADNTPNQWGETLDPARRDMDGDGITDELDLDSDNDGINDVREGGGTDANGDGRADGAIATTGIPASAGTGGLPKVDSDGDGIPNSIDLDSDNDGVTDVRENGGTDADNNGRADGVDTDGDGIVSSADGAPGTWGDSSDPVTVDTDGDGVPDYRDLDSDNDGIADLKESGNPALVDANNDGKVDIPGPDPDADGIVGSADGAPNAWGDANAPALADTDGDGIPNMKDLDSDNDGLTDVREAGGTDANGDGRADGTVATTGIPSSAGTGGLTSLDSDGDGKPNAYDLDSDNDGITDLKESGNTAQVDTNNDGRVDGNIDVDKDGIIGSADGAPNAWGDANDPALADTDGDGVPNMRDLDSDNDGLTDVREAGGTDANGDGKADGAIGTNGVPATAGNGLVVGDSDGDGVSNEKDLDSDNDGISDLKENNPALADANNDGKVDGTDPDGDGIVGAADGAPNTWGDANDPALLDSDGDGVPNIKDLDSDNDGINDVREAGGTDANGDGKADGTVNVSTGFPASAGNGGLAPLDTDGDGVSNDKDLDSDNDGITDVRENGGTDANNDGRADGTDADGDGIVSGVDGSPNSWGDSNDPVAVDSDGDGRPDFRDLDSDNDGKSDLVESGNPTAIAGDTNNDGVIDFNNNDADGDGALTPADGTPTWGTNTPAPVDTDGDGIPDYKDPVTGTKKDIDDTPYKDKDTNGDGKITGADTGGGTDSDGDGIPNIIDADNGNFGGLASNIGINVKAFLRGAFQGARHKDVSASWMTVLQQFALTQPYNTTAFGSYAGTESVTAATFTSSASSDADVVDWVLLELKKADGTLVDRHAALILENGNVVGTDKVSPVYFKVLPGSYHITIRHRNHLGLSTELTSLSSTGTSFDFTTATDAMLFGNSAAYATKNGKTCLIAGNANSNGNVRFNGSGNDRDAMLSYLGFNEIGFITGVYTPTDVNLDGNVRYNGSANDRDFLLEMLNFDEIGFIQEQIK